MRHNIIEKKQMRLLQSDDSVPETERTEQKGEMRMPAKEKSKKLTLSELKRHLSGLTREETTDLICRLYKSGPEAVRLLNAEFNREAYLAELYKETKDKIRKEFFPARGMGRLSLRDAKAAISAFKKVCPDPEAVLDLQLFYVECGVKFSKQYGDLYDAFYYSMGNMFTTVVETLNKLDDEALFRRFEGRMRNLLSAEDYDPGFTDAFSAFTDLNWEREAFPEEKEAIPPELDDSSGPTLSPENAKRFFNIMMPLESWINRKYQLFPELGERFTQRDVNMSQVHKLMNELWGHANSIRDYLAECGDTLSEADRQIISGWTRFVRGRFMIERYLKSGAIFIPVDGKKRVYLVSGITSEIEENIPRNALPVMVQTTLIPFMGRIIYDGLMVPFSVAFGGGIKGDLKETYLDAKREEHIIKQL